jgi:glycosyltransferase involved in cell wall biosynthesis
MTAPGSMGGAEKKELCVREEEREVILITPAWPSGDGGQRIAVRSLIQACQQVFSRIHLIAITQEPLEHPEKWRHAGVLPTHAKIAARPKWLRFAESLFTSAPAVTARYSQAREQVMDAVSAIVADARSRSCELFAIIEDVPTACLLMDMQGEFLDLPVAVRSENLLTEAFARLATEGPLLKRLAWRLEIRKIRRFEGRVCVIADRFWAITFAEADAYAKQFGMRPSGVFGVCLDVDRYQMTLPGDPATVVHVGTADMRKGKGLHAFVRNVWPLVRRAVPEARLVLGGRGTERFSDAHAKVEGLGFVDDDQDVLGRGLIFINPQLVGAGLQLKTIVAMLAGKALVSTTVGAEGAEGIHGNHLLVADAPEETAAAIVGLMRHPDRAREMGVRAQQLAAETYSERRFLEESTALLHEFVQGTGTSGKHHE